MNAKWLFLVLVLANLLTVVWFARQPEPLAESDSRLLLQAEIPKLESINPAAAQSYPEVPAPLSPPNAEIAGSALPWCLQLGPFADDLGAERVLLELQAQGFQVTRRVQDEDFKVGDWIFIPPAADFEAAKREMSRLRALGLRDLYVVASEQWRNAISLGLYSNPGGVERRMRELKALGVDARVESRFRTRRSYWVDARGNDPAPPVSLTASAEINVVDCALQNGEGYNTRALDQPANDDDALGP